MTEAFPWVPGRVGAWLAGRLGDGPDGLRDTVPDGFDVVIRILPPFSRDRPETGTFADWETQVASADWDSAPELLTESVSWADTAAALGRDLEDVPRSWDLLGAAYGEANDALAADGWRYSAPREGTLPPELFTRVLGVLARQTSTPDTGVAGVWEGYGGLVSAQGVGWFFGVPDPPRWIPRPLLGLGLRVMSHVLSFRERRRHFGFPSAVRALFFPCVSQPPGSGVLSRQAARGERLSLPYREYVCFAVGPRALAAADWSARAPWIPEVERGDPQSPNIVWPEGREWVLVSEIDFDSTLVACSAACAGALLSEPGIEAHRVWRDTALF
ncbi:hypothetical protein FM113_06960 [Leucobacter sp. 7(1)]|uniref:hypothetical protein n=1 Tax=Leucobacter sp. 7(1) TaxID=1255613 RepID=UPI00097EA0AA|nr:hypothetical protein [Leucobacter sp. 7(1)]SJN09694.1 hypothetical protein FM113_06960 [Leucobacter sp. 7(1)]